MASKFLLAALLLAPSVLGRALPGEVNEIAALDERAVAYVRLSTSEQSATSGTNKV
jgi:hypothetical protein